MSGSHAVSKTTEGYPVFTNLTDSYIDGYDPVSLYAPHSSLQRTSTWIGMGLILFALAGLGTLTFAFAANTVGTQEDWQLYAIIGAVLTVVALIGGFGLIHRGRRHYRKYRSETGRIN